MTAFVCNYSSNKRSAYKGEVPDEIYNFVPCAFVWESKAVFDRPIGTNNQDVPGAKMRSYATRLKLLCLGFK